MLGAVSSWHGFQKCAVTGAFDPVNRAMHRLSVRSQSSRADQVRCWRRLSPSDHPTLTDLALREMQLTLPGEAESLTV